MLSFPFAVILAFIHSFIATLHQPSINPPSTLTIAPELTFSIRLSPRKQDSLTFTHISPQLEARCAWVALIGPLLALERRNCSCSDLNTRSQSTNGREWRPVLMRSINSPCSALTWPPIRIPSDVNCMVVSVESSHIEVGGVLMLVAGKCVGEV